MIMSDLFYSLFEFSVDDISNVFNCPNRKRRAVFQDKGLTTGINVEKGSGLGHVSALFDNVYTNNTSSAYEDFSIVPLDPTKWKSLEIVREIAEGSLRFNAQAVGKRRSVTLTPADQNTNYLKQRFTLKVEAGYLPEF